MITIEQLSDTVWQARVLEQRPFPEEAYPDYVAVVTLVMKPNHELALVGLKGDPGVDWIAEFNAALPQLKALGARSLIAHRNGPPRLPGWKPAPDLGPGWRRFLFSDINIAE